MKRVLFFPCQSLNHRGLDTAHAHIANVILKIADEFEATAQSEIVLKIA